MTPLHHPPLKHYLRVRSLGVYLGLALLLCQSVCVAQAVYVTVGANGRPLYTVSPVSDRSQQVSANTDQAGAALAPLAPGWAGTAQLAMPAGLRSAFNISADRAQYKTLATKYARLHGIDEHLVHALIEVESGFNPRAVSTAGARGLMQLMPATARRFDAYDLFDPHENLRAGTSYLRLLIDMFPQDARLAIAAYNAGEGAVIKYRHQIPPYAETRRYVPAVVAAWKRNRMTAR